MGYGARTSWPLSNLAAYDGHWTTRRRDRSYAGRLVISRLAQSDRARGASRSWKPKFVVTASFRFRRCSIETRVES